MSNQDTLREKYDNQNLKQQIILMYSLRIELDALKQEKTRIQKDYDYLRHNKIPNTMEEEGIENITIEGIGRVTLTSDINASIPAASRVAAYEWLQENGFGDLVIGTVNASTLKAFIKGQLKAGNSVPEKLFSVRPFTRATITHVT